MRPTKRSLQEALPFITMYVKFVLTLYYFVHKLMANSRKYPNLYHGRLLGFPKGRGGSLNWNSEGMGEYLRLEIRRHGGISQGGFLE